MNDKFLKKNLSKFRKDTFTGFIGVVVDNAKKITDKVVVPFVKLLADEYAFYQEAYNYDPCDGLTKEINAVVAEADAKFCELNSKVKAIVTLGIAGAGAAQEVKNIINKNGYAPSKSMDTRFEIIKFVVDAAKDVDMADLDGFGVPAILQDLADIREKYLKVLAERKALRDKRKRKIAECRKAIVKRYGILTSLVELLITDGSHADLRGFVVQVNESLIWISQKSKLPLSDAAPEAGAGSVNDDSNTEC